MKRLLSLALGLFATSAIAGRHEDVIIHSATELRDWCKEESEATLIGRGLTPFNWTASYWDQVDTLRVKGQWRTDSVNMVVECSVARGAEARFATVTIQESQ